MSFQMVLLPAAMRIVYDAVFWNYVIPDGSTTLGRMVPPIMMFWNYVIPDGSTTMPLVFGITFSFWNYVIPDGSTTRQQMDNIG